MLKTIWDREGSVELGQYNYDIIEVLKKFIFLLKITLLE